MSVASSFISEDHLLNHYTHEIEHVFKMKYRENLNKLKRIQQDPSIDPIEKINNLRDISWRTFHLRFMIHLYLHILNGNRRFMSSCYIHLNVFQLDNFLTPERREKHFNAIQRHENAMKRLLERIWEKIYSKVNYHIYIFYNGVLL
jgi:hypothetical protein